MEKPKKRKEDEEDINEDLEDEYFPEDYDKE